jgi:hypothetical protein
MWPIRHTKFQLNRRQRSKKSNRQDLKDYQQNNHGERTQRLIAFNRKEQNSQDEQNLRSPCFLLFDSFCDLGVGRLALGIQRSMFGVRRFLPYDLRPLIYDFHIEKDWISS